MVQFSGALYELVTQKVLLYGGGIWVVMGDIMKVLEGFPHRAVWKIAGMRTRCAGDGEWENPPVDDGIEAAGIWMIKEYIQRRQATIAAQVAC